jgi:hypothetical protein
VTQPEAMLARMPLNAASRTVTPSDVWESRACADKEEDCVEVTVPREVVREMEAVARIVSCSPERELCNAVAALAVR